MPAHYCSPRALEFLHESLPRLSTADGLFDCAVAVAMHSFSDCRPESIRERVAGLAERASYGARDPLAVLSRLHAEFFDGDDPWIGDDCLSRHPTAAMAPFVLRFRRGLPVTMCLLFHCVASRLGLQTEGVALRGHFLVRVRNADGPKRDQTNLLDPYRGGLLVKPSEAIAYARGRLIAEGRREYRLPISLRTVTHIQWLIRLVDDLQELLRRGFYRDDWRAMEELRQVIVRQERFDRRTGVA